MKYTHTITTIILTAILALTFYSCENSDDSTVDLNTDDPSENRGLRLVADTLNLKMDNLIFPSALENQTSPIALDLYSKLLANKVKVETYAVLTTIPENTERTSFETPVELSFTEIHNWENNGDLMKFTIVENGQTLNIDLKLEIKSSSSETYETVMDGFMYNFDSDTEAFFYVYENDVEISSLQLIKYNSETRTRTIIEEDDERTRLSSDTSNGRFTVYIEDAQTDDYIWSDNGNSGFYTNPTPFVGGSW